MNLNLNYKILAINELDELETLDTVTIKKGKLIAIRVISIAFHEIDQENNRTLYYVYSPSLDIIGYGMTKEKADDSFKLVLDEFVDYVNKKGTLITYLEQQGWILVENKNQASEHVSQQKKLTKKIKKELSQNIPYYIVGNNRNNINIDSTSFLQG